MVRRSTNRGRTPDGRGVFQLGGSVGHVLLGMPSSGIFTEGSSTRHSSYEVLASPHCVAAAGASIDWPHADDPRRPFLGVLVRAQRPHLAARHPPDAAALAGRLGPHHRGRHHPAGRAARRRSPAGRRVARRRPGCARRRRLLRRLLLPSAGPAGRRPGPHLGPQLAHGRVRDGGVRAARRAGHARPRGSARPLRVRRGPHVARGVGQARRRRRAPRPRDAGRGVGVRVRCPLRLRHGALRQRGRHLLAVADRDLALGVPVHRVAGGASSPVAWRCPKACASRP